MAALSLSLAALSVNTNAQLAMPTVDVTKILSACSFPVSAAACGYSTQAKSADRVSVVSGGRDGSTALRLHTNSGDNNVFGSGTNERTDVALTQAQTNCYQGVEQWWAHSMLFPSDFNLTGGWGQAVFDFHHTTSGSGQANVEIGVNSSGMMNLHGNGGAPTTPTWRPPEFSVNLGTIQRNVWYDMVYHVKWSQNSDGYLIAWMNGKKVLTYNGPTIYQDQGCYLKLQNYRVPDGGASSVIHDRVVLGSTAAAVALTALEGVSGTGTTSADSTAPSVPAGLTGSAVSSSQIKLNWNASTDNVGVTGYKVYVNDTLVTSTTGTTFTQSGLAANTTYNYRVSAFDAAGNNSAWTATPVAVKTNATSTADTSAPSVPGSLAGAAVSNTQINLTWSPATDNVGVTGYYVYLNDAVLAKVTGTSFSHTGLTAGSTYSYRVSAFDAAGNNSAWTATPVSVQAKVASTAKHVAYDFNGDGKSDILWNNKSTGANLLWFMNANANTVSGQFATQSDLNWKVVGSGDFNGDGKADILYRNSSTGANQILFMDGQTVTSTLQLPVAGVNWTVADVADFNGDGKADILWRTSSQQQPVIWLSNGTGQPEMITVSAGADNNHIVAGTGDFNGDGKADILWRNTTTGNNIIWFMNGGAIQSTAYATAQTDQNWQVAGIGDFNGDGKADIFWRNRSTGQNAVWLQNGASRLSSATLATIADQKWGVAQVADFNGDGKADLLWRNTSTGSDSIWFMNGSATSSTPYITAVTDLNWQIK
jgi:chitodextrinase